MKHIINRLLLLLALAGVFLLPSYASELPTAEDYAADPYQENFPLDAYQQEEDDAAAAETTDSTAFTVTSYGSSDSASKIVSTLTSGIYDLNMPASADPTALTMYFNLYDSMTVKGPVASAAVKSGEAVNLTELCGQISGTSYYSLTLTASGKSYSLRVRFSENSSAMYLTSDDPKSKGRAWVETNKNNKATGSMLLQNADGKEVYNAALTQIKGRGNSTWSAKKKPYQIKLDKKTDLLETGDKSNKNKTWVLLANAYDGTLIHNAVTFDLAAAMGMETTVQYRFVDLYYDGVYRGSYLLTEKVQIDSGRVDITDLEGENEDANPDTDFSTLSRGYGTTSNGATYVYWKGITDPTDISGGYLLEMDYSSRATAEASYFKTKQGHYIVVKSPEYCSKAEMEYIASYYQEFEDVLYYGVAKSETGKTLADYMDLKSVAQCYLLNEISKNPDSFLSSAYIYKDAGDDIMRMGPVWDFDIAWGYGNFSNYSRTVGATGWFSNTFGIMTKLLANSEFKNITSATWRNEVAPLLQNVLLGSENSVSQDGALHSLTWYENLTAASAAENYSLWAVTSYTGNYPAGKTYASNISYFNKWVSNRYTWLSNNMVSKLGGISGWDSVNGKWYYYQNNVRQTGWQKLNDSWYYFDSDGVMQTGWVSWNSGWYYLNDNGAMVTGWVKWNENWYYLDSSGVMRTGWVKDGESWYYLSGSGCMQTGWLFSGNRWYYLSRSGAMIAGWQRWNSNWYYFDSSSGAMKTGWLSWNGSWYYMDTSEGSMQTGWISDDGLRYYMDKNGIMVTGWQEIQGKRYYFNTDGSMKADCQWNDGKCHTYTFAADGVMTADEVSHAFDAGAANTPEEGQITYTCRVCGETKTETMPSE